MTKEVEKAIKKANKKDSKISQIKYWWGQNSDKVYRVIFFPIWIITIMSQKLKKYSYSKIQWSEKETERILNYYIPKRARYNKEKRTFYLYCNSYEDKYLKRKDRKFWAKFNYEIRTYLKEQYELEGFKKITNIYLDIIDIKFVQI